MAGRIGIFHEKHLFGKSVERIAEAPAAIVGGIPKQCGNLLLGVTKGVRGKVHVVDGREVTGCQLICFVAEKPCEAFASDHRAGITYIEGQPKGLDLVRGEWQGRAEVSAEATHIVDRYFPNTEETEDMVDAEAVEVFAELTESRLPPCEIVALHHLPVVGREAPVLPHGGEVVGWSACLLLRVEIRRVGPRVHAGPVDTDR